MNVVRTEVGQYIGIANVGGVKVELLIGAPYTHIQDVRRRFYELAEKYIRKAVDEKYFPGATELVVRPVMPFTDLGPQGFTSAEASAAGEQWIQKYSADGWNTVYQVDVPMQKVIVLFGNIVPPHTELKTNMIRITKDTNVVAIYDIQPLAFDPLTRWILWEREWEFRNVRLKIEHNVRNPNPASAYTYPVFDNVVYLGFVIERKGRTI